MNITIDAYAKINLHLDVTKIRDDGYHDIQSIMQSVSLCDVVEIETLDEQKIVIECDVDGVPLDERNIAYKAAKAFFDESGISCGAIIKIKKNKKHVHINCNSGSSGINPHVPDRPDSGV